MIHIREAVPADARAIAKVHVDSWRTTYVGIVPDEYLASLSYDQREQAWGRILTYPETVGFTLVAENEQAKIIGFAGAGPLRGEHSGYQGELYALYLLQRYQRKGIGTRLVSIVAERLVRMGFRSMLVWVLEKNPACEFYEKLGGKLVEKRDHSIGERPLIEIAYGWADIQPLVGSK